MLQRNINAANQFHPLMEIHMSFLTAEQVIAANKAVGGIKAVSWIGGHVSPSATT